MSHIISQVSLALTQKQRNFLKWPSTEEEILQNKHGFFTKGGFPGVIGCVDGTCIKIQAPHENENDVVNRKGFHSINVQAICNHKDRLNTQISQLMFYKNCKITFDREGYSPYRRF